MAELQPIESLVTTGKRVSEQFAVLEGLSEVNRDDRNSLTNALQRFELWAVNLGLYHGGHSSLDYRFRDSPPLFRYAYKLLRDLEIGLSQLREAFGDSLVPSSQESAPEDDRNTAGSTCSDDSEEEDFSSYQTEPLTKTYLDNITTTIDRLYSLSFKIRNPAMRIGLSKALKYTEVDPDTGVNLIEEYASLDQSHLAELFRSFGHRSPDNLKNHYLVQRLARANTRRRQQFRYWRKRKVKYEKYPKPVEGALGNPQNLNIQMERDLRIVDGPRSAPSLPSTATALNPAQVKLEDDSSIISTTTFLIMADEKSGDHVSIPPPPAIDSDTKEFECPYCFTICPRKTITKKVWETHIFRDLRPYVCTFEDCKEPDQQYDTLSDWVAHETLKHKVTTELGSGHQEDTRDCPLCLVPNAGPVHVACHLRRIACFSLPRSASDRGGPAVGSEISDQAAIESHSSERSSMESVSWEAWSENVPTTRQRSKSEVEADQSGMAAEKGAEQPQELNEESTDEMIGGRNSAVSREKDKLEDRLGLLLGNRLELVSILGADSYKAIDIHTNVPYTAKAINKNGLNHRQLKLRQREIKLHHLASEHPNVISMDRIMDSDDCTFVVIEFCSEGDLFSNITERGKFVGNDPLVKRVFLQILDAVQFCHSIGIYHHDLRPENIFVTDQGMTIKVANFSCATTDYIRSDFDGCGSTFYMSPGERSSSLIC
ncbi:hypothetical protein FQN54_000628 [Arachnomyces sp. PD_36]|nr:hypothetical protein FQN54_000628 [Arachnomyces sp. PD_36]